MERAAVIGCLAGAATAVAVTVALTTQATTEPETPSWPLTPRYGEVPSTGDERARTDSGTARERIILLPPARGRATIERW